MSIDDTLCVDRILATVNNQFESSFLEDELFEAYESNNNNSSSWPSLVAQKVVDPRRRSVFQDFSREKMNLADSVRRKRIGQVFRKLEENRQHVMRYQRSKRLAENFHRYVVLLKHFFKWKNYVQNRASYLSSQKKLLRKILLKWKSYAEESHMKSIAAFYTIRTVDVIIVQVIGIAMERWKKKCWQKRHVQKMLSAWKLGATSTLTRLRVNKRRSDERMIKAIVGEWRRLVKFHSFQRRGDGVMFKKVLDPWKNITDRNIIARELQMRQAKSFNEDRGFKRLSRIFNHIRIYSQTKKKYRIAYRQTLNRYVKSLQCIVLNRWKDRCEFARKFRNSISVSIQRRYFTKWKYQVDMKIKHEATVGKIILNRWNMYADRSAKRRNLNLLALKHWAHHSTQLIFKYWLSISSSNYCRLKPLKEARGSRSRYDYRNRYDDTVFRIRNDSTRSNFEERFQPPRFNGPGKHIMVDSRDCIPQKQIGRFHSPAKYRTLPLYQWSRVDCSTRRALRACSAPTGVPMRPYERGARSDYHDTSGFETDPNQHAIFNCKTFEADDGETIHRPPEGRLALKRPEWVVKALAERERAQDETNNRREYHTDQSQRPITSLSAYPMLRAEAKSSSPYTSRNSVKVSSNLDRKQRFTIPVLSREEFQVSEETKRDIWMDEK